LHDLKKTIYRFRNKFLVIERKIMSLRQTLPHHRKHRLQQGGIPFAAGGIPFAPGGIAIGHGHGLTQWR
jgi:hypothetical protein